MKRLSLFALILALAMLLGGCMRLEFEMKINDNGKADISMIYAMSDSFGPMSESDSDSMMSDEDVEEYKKKGWTVSQYAADGYTGYRISKQNTELDDLLMLEDADSKIEKNGSTYKIDINA
ncbi:MAG: hypothetical protein IJR83_08375, partial [Clostridia bacterium]|nr:hypothetical protein [Clostridia bacterium]